MTLSAASLGAIPLLRGDGSPCSGGAFDLVHPPAGSHTVVLDNGWTVEISAETQVVVARGGSDEDYATALRSSIVNAQRGLDLLSVQGHGHLLIKSFSTEHLVWWLEAGSLVLRMLSVARMRFGATANAIVIRDGSGVVLPPATPALAWHESFRYIRLSQATDDLFDAYRNAYLALESILSSIAPQRLRPNGGIAEREGDWFRRALTVAAGLIDTSSFVPAGTSEPVDYLWNEFYRDMRSAMSHAKSGRRILLPQDEAEREAVAGSLFRLVRFWYALADAQFNLRPAGATLGIAAFRRMSANFERYSAYASDDQSPASRDESVANPAGGSLVIMPAVSPVQVEGLIATKLWAADAAQLEVLPAVRRIVACDDDGEPALTAVLRADLSLGSVSRFEAMLGIAVSNSGQPRDHYSY